MTTIFTVLGSSIDVIASLAAIAVCFEVGKILVSDAREVYGRSVRRRPAITIRVTLCLAAATLALLAIWL